MRKTKIICTIGPATGSYEMLERLYAAGMNVVRLNMSHGDHESHARVIKAIRTLNRKVRYTVPVMLDTQGPEIRTGHLSAELDLREGQEITIVVRGAEHVEESSIQIDYADIINAVEVGDRITVDNGLINLEVLSKQERVMRCRVVDGGIHRQCGPDDGLRRTGSAHGTHAGVERGASVVHGIPGHAGAPSRVASTSRAVAAASARCASRVRATSASTVPARGP